MRRMLYTGAGLGFGAVLFVTAAWAQQQTMLQPTPMQDPGRIFAIEVDRGRVGPSVKKRVKPEYPLEAAAMGIEGVVEVGLMVDALGRPRDLRIIRTDSPILNQAALDAVAKWTFYPGRSGTLAYDTSVKFSLSRKEQREAQARLPLKSPLRPVYRVAPDYPLDAELVDLSGEVVVEFVVTETGAVKEARVIKSSHEVFNKPALAAIAKWAFIPAMAEGKFKPSRLQMPMVFKQPSHVQFLARLRSEVNPPGLTARKVASVERLEPNFASVVYPFEELMENKQGVVKATVTWNETGRPPVVQWRESPPETFRFAIEAMLDTLPADNQSAKNPNEDDIWNLRLTFNPYDGDVRINDAAAAILKRLRLEGGAAQFAGEQDLDGQLEFIDQTNPVFPSRLSREVTKGSAEIEYFIDQTGQALLPRIVSASDPAFGYAACQAVAGWKLQVPLKAGKPVVARVRAPFEFQRD